MLVSCDDPGPTSGARFGSPGQPLPNRHRPAHDTRLTWCDHPTQPLLPCGSRTSRPAPAPVLLPTAHPHDATPLSAHYTQCWPWQDPDLWTCPVNPHLMYIWCNIYLFIYLLHAVLRTPRHPARPLGARTDSHWQGARSTLPRHRTSTPPTLPSAPFSATHCHALHATQHSARTSSHPTPPSNLPRHPTAASHTAPTTPLSNHCNGPLTHILPS
jgi:hypothetical protein